MADVARLAGVSTTTVSHVLNNTRTVAAGTEKLVRNALVATGYRHNLAARALATRSTATIGLAMSVVTNPYFAQLVRGIEHHLRALGYTLILADTGDDPEVELDVINHLLGRRVTGLIVDPLEGNPALTGCLQDLLDERFPLIVLDRRSTLPSDQVYSECVESAYLLTTHLASIGHTRIGFVGGATKTTSAQDRLAGYRKAVVEHGLCSDAHLLIPGESNEGITEQRVIEHLTGTEQPASALVVSNNQMTLGTLRALRYRGLSVPDDIALVCYDDFEWADLFQPRISAMAQDSAALASTVVNMLLARIKDANRPPQTVTISTNFQHRDSCGCAANSDLAR